MSILNKLVSVNGSARGGKNSWTKKQMVTAIGLKAAGVSNQEIGELTGHPKLSVQYLFTVKLKDAEAKNPTEEAFFKYLEVTDSSEFAQAAKEALAASQGNEEEVA